MRIRAFALLIGVVALTTQSRAQFGARAGQPISELSGRATKNTHFYNVTVPTPNSEFEAYSAISTPQTGVCKVWGVGKDYKDDAYGYEVRSAYKRLKTALENKYGAGREFNYLKSGSIWNEARDWVMAVNKNERTLTSFWSPNNGNTMPAGVVGITLEVEAYRSDTAYVDLTYEFSNFTRCKAVLQARNSDGL